MKAQWQDRFVVRSAVTLRLASLSIYSVFTGRRTRGTPRVLFFSFFWASSSSSSDRAIKESTERENSLLLVGILLYIVLLNFVLGWKGKSVTKYVVT